MDRQKIAYGEGIHNMSLFLSQNINMHFYRNLSEFVLRGIPMRKHVIPLAPY